MGWAGADPGYGHAQGCEGRHPQLCHQAVQAPLQFHFWSWPWVIPSAANRSSGEVVQSRRRPLLGPSPGYKRLLALSHLRHY